MRTAILLSVVGAFVAMAGGVQAEVAPSRKTISLDGTWQVTEGTMEAIPQKFEHTVPVPGLIDMAQPVFAEVGKKSDRRQAFWYRRTFTIERQIPAFAILKIHKAKYGTKVWLNGQVVGEHLPCFTPAYMDVRPYLKGEGQSNELIVRVGAERTCVPAGQPNGWDFEKYLYIPGIYDSVELILTGAPHVVNVQTAPDLANSSVRVRVTLRSSAEVRMFPLDLIVREAVSGREIGRAAANPAMGQDEEKTFDETVHIPDCHLWSPEDPFLYEMEVSTHFDQVKVRFGMRSFRFDAASGRAILNGKPYFMRGTNICIYRFFEDAERGDKPWRAEWVRRLHEKFKTMHWNAMRWCIGFPPDFWYDMADEAGFLIQDEFPIWTLDQGPEKVEAEKIIPEYTEWMRERWNHPCVVIWDAQNESRIAETGKALMAVRHLDLSNRPWDNGWAEPQTEQDCVEAHPYLMSGLFNASWGNAKFKSLKDMVTVSGIPSLQAAQRKLKVPIIINEYGWMWLNRDGSTTCLTGPVYEKLLGPNSTAEQRRETYAKYLAAMTEFWRAHRACAGVLHFCGLGYSRAGDKPRPEGGATSDHFIDLEKLVFEPNFEKYVRDAFAPVGLMLDYWGQDLMAHKEQEFKVVVINDLYQDCKGTLRLRLLKDQTVGGVKGEKVVDFSQDKPFTVTALGRETVSLTLPLSCLPGPYRLVAELTTEEGTSVRSVRDARVIVVW